MSNCLFYITQKFTWQKVAGGALFLRRREAMESEVPRLECAAAQSNGECPLPMFWNEVIDSELCKRILAGGAGFKFKSRSRHGIKFVCVWDDAATHAELNFTSMSGNWLGEAAHELSTLQHRVNVQFVFLSFLSSPYLSLSLSLFTRWSGMLCPSCRAAAVSAFLTRPHACFAACPLLLPCCFRFSGLSPRLISQLLTRLVRSSCLPAPTWSGSGMLRSVVSAGLVRCRRSGTLWHDFCIIFACGFSWNQTCCPKKILTPVGGISWNQNWPKEADPHRGEETFLETRTDRRR